MLPTRSNFDGALAFVWERVPDAVFATDLGTKMALVSVKRGEQTHAVPMLPGFAWSNTPERTGEAVVKGLKL